VKQSLRPDLGRFNVSRETEERLEAFVQVLQAWSPRLNLVSRHDLGAVWPRHVIDSLQLVQFIPVGLSHAIDLGSGAGFPGLIIAIAAPIHVHLIESDRRKAAFLREAARVSGTVVSIHAERIEALAIPRAPLVTARALAPLPRLLTLAAPLVAESGTCLFLKGASAQAELDEARQHWHMDVLTHESCTSPDAKILEIRDLRHA